MTINKIDAPTWNVEVTNDFPLLDDPQGFTDDEGNTMLQYIEYEHVQEYADVLVAHKEDILQTIPEAGRDPVFLNLDGHITDGLRRAIGSCPLEGNCVVKPFIDGIKGQDVSEATISLSCSLKGLQSIEEAEASEARCEAHHETAPDSVESFCAEIVTNVLQAKIYRDRADERYVNAIADL